MRVTVDSCAQRTPHWQHRNQAPHSSMASKDRPTNPRGKPRSTQAAQHRHRRTHESSTRLRPHCAERGLLGTAVSAPFQQCGWRTVWPGACSPSRSCRPADLAGSLVTILSTCVSYLIFCALSGKVLVTSGPLPFILNMNSVLAVPVLPLTRLLRAFCGSSVSKRAPCHRAERAQSAHELRGNAPGSPKHPLSNRAFVPH